MIILVIFLIFMIYNRNRIGIIRNDTCYTLTNYIQIPKVDYINVCWIKYNDTEIDMYCINLCKYNIKLTFPSSKQKIYYEKDGKLINNPYYYGSHVNIEKDLFIIKERVKKGFSYIEKEKARTNKLPHIE